CKTTRQEGRGYGTKLVTLASGNRSAHVPGREPRPRRQPGGPRSLPGPARLRADTEARRDADPPGPGPPPPAPTSPPLQPPPAPQHTPTSSPAQASTHIYDTPPTYDEKTNTQPCLATSGEITKGGKTYTLKPRPNVNSHNGQTMTADDVKYSIERVLDPKTAS